VVAVVAEVKFEEVAEVEGAKAEEVELRVKAPQKMPLVPTQIFSRSARCPLRVEEVAEVEGAKAEEVGLRVKSPQKTPLVPTQIFSKSARCLLQVEEVAEVEGAKGEEVELPVPTQNFSRSARSLTLPAVESIFSINGCMLRMAPTTAHPLARRIPSTLMACTHV